MLKNIIFDFDGVLVDSEVLSGRAFSQYLAKKNIFLPEEEISRTYAGMKTVDIISELSLKYHIQDREIFFDEVMSIANDMYANELTTTVGAKKLLDSIQHFKLIASNSPKERIVKGLKKVGLSKFFDEDNIFSFDIVENPKPHPDVYLKAVEVTGIHSQDTIIIEDSIVGIQAGVAANMRVIGLTIGSHWKGRSPQILFEAGACSIAKNFKELLNIINKL
jgi:HAD superfamily hydrolase (TIGR01509 family)